MSLTGKKKCASWDMNWKDAQPQMEPAGCI